MEVISVTAENPRLAGGSLNFQTKSYGASRPPGVGPEGVKSGVFFDVLVKGLSAGKVMVHITHDSVTPSHRIQHWDDTNMRWIDHPKTVSAKTIHGEFDASELQKTPIVIGV